MRRNDCSSDGVVRPDEVSNSRGGSLAALAVTRNRLAPPKNSREDGGARQAPERRVRAARTTMRVRSCGPRVMHWSASIRCQRDDLGPEIPRYFRAREPRGSFVPETFNFPQRDERDIPLVITCTPAIQTPLFGRPPRLSHDAAKKACPRRRKRRSQRPRGEHPRR